MNSGQFFDLIQLLSAYYPYVFFLASALNVFAFMWGIMRSHFLQDRRGEIYWKSAIVSQVIVLGVGVAIKVIDGLVPLPVITVSPEFPSGGANPQLPIFGSGGIPEVIISLILGIGTKIIQSLYNGFIKQLSQFTIVLSSYFLASNFPYDMLFSVFGKWIFAGVTGVFLIMLIFKVVAYALAVNGVGDPDKEKAEIWNLFIHYFMSLFSMVFIIFVFRVVAIFTLAVLKLLPKETLGGQTVYGVVHGGFAPAGTPKYSYRIFLNLKLVFFDPVFNLLKSSIETVQVDAGTLSKKFPWIYLFDQVAHGVPQLLLKFKYDWEVYLAFGMMGILLYNSVVLIFVSLKRLIWSVILIVVAPFAILFKGISSTWQMGSQFIRDIIATIMAPLVISILYVIWYYMGLPSRLVQGLSYGEPTGSFGIPDFFASLSGVEPNTARWFLVILVFQIIISLVFVSLLLYLPGIASSILSGLLAGARSIGGTFIGSLGTGIGLSFMATKTAVGLGASALKLGVSGAKALGLAGGGLLAGKGVSSLISKGATMGIGGTGAGSSTAGSIGSGSSYFASSGASSLVSEGGAGASAGASALGPVLGVGGIGGAVASMWYLKQKSKVGGMDVINEIGTRIGEGEWGKGPSDTDRIFGAITSPDKVNTDSELIQQYKGRKGGIFTDDKIKASDIPSVQTQMLPRFSTGSEKALSLGISGRISQGLSQKYTPSTPISKMKDDDIRKVLVDTARDIGVDPDRSLKAYNIIRDSGGSKTDAIMSSVSAMTSMGKKSIPATQQAELNSLVERAETLNILKNLNEEK